VALTEEQIQSAFKLLDIETDEKRARFKAMAEPQAAFIADVVAKPQSDAEMRKDGDAELA
jgi:hypothetical protein